MLAPQQPPLWNLAAGEKVRIEELVEVEMAPQTSLEVVQTPLGQLAQCHPARLPQAVVETCLNLHDLLGDEVRIPLSAHTHTHI